jgi:hypothetical protein
MAQPIEFPGQNVVYGKDQKEYLPLPAKKEEDGTVTTCWELTPEERMQVFNTGKIYLKQMTFNQPLQPQNVFIDMEEKSEG